MGSFGIGASKLTKVVVDVVESFAFLGMVLAFNVLALVFGKDTRDENDWVRHNYIR